MKSTPLASGSLRSALLRCHWLEVQRHIYGHSAHGSAATIPGGWEAFLWQRDNRKVALVCSAGASSLSPAIDFIHGLGAGWTILVEIEALDPLCLELEDAGFVSDYLLPGHFIPTSPYWKDQAFVGRPFPPLRMRFVESPETLADFAFVQDQAYRASYDWPKGCAGLFYTDPASLIGPDSVGLVLYEADGLPVRTAALIHKRGIVAGVAGAAVPSVRGQHLGEQLMYALLHVARRTWGAEEVHHITMPCARPIAARLGLETVTMYHRWKDTICRA